MTVELHQILVVTESGASSWIWTQTLSFLLLRLHFFSRILHGNRSRRFVLKKERRCRIRHRHDGPDAAVVKHGRFILLKGSSYSSHVLFWDLYLSETMWRFSHTATASQHSTPVKETIITTIPVTVRNVFSPIIQDCLHASPLPVDRGVPQVLQAVCVLRHWADRRQGGWRRNTILGNGLIAEEIGRQSSRQRFRQLSAQTVVDVCQDSGDSSQKPGVLEKKHFSLDEKHPESIISARKLH